MSGRRWASAMKRPASVETSDREAAIHFVQTGYRSSVGGLAIMLAAHRGNSPGTSDAVESGGRRHFISFGGGGDVSIARGVVWTMSIAKVQVAAAAILISLAVVGGGVTVIVAEQHPVASAPPATVPTSQPEPTDDKIHPNERPRITISDLVAARVRECDVAASSRSVGATQPSARWADTRGRRCPIGSGGSNQPRAYHDAQLITVRSGFFAVSFYERGSEENLYSVRPICKSAITPYFTLKAS